MPAPGHIRVRWNGVFRDTSVADPWEIWSIGLALAFGGGGAGGGDPTGGYAALAQAMIAPWLNFIGGQSSDQVGLTEVKASRVGADGRVIRDAAGGYVQGVAPANAGGAQAAIYPSQVSLVVTLDTAAAGATGRGRFFIPGPGQKVLQRGQMTLGAVAVVADAAKGFVNAVAAAATAQGVGPVVVASGGSIVRGTPPALRPVTGVRVGSRLDVLRSRANALDETYTKRPIP